jgi:anti-sigma regulatory factor (Ser/Thr protein kinase)
MTPEEQARCLISPDVDATAPQRARAMVVKALAGWGFAGMADDAALCVSELVTNALNEAPTKITVRVEWHRADHLIELAVWDDAPGKPEKRAPTVNDPGGRGLNIVEALADGWGHHPEGDGKTVWARFHTTAEGTSDAA